MWNYENAASWSSPYHSTWYRNTLCDPDLATSSQGLVDFQQTTDSGCRTLLWLHRALLWLQGFLEKPAHTLADIAFIAMPEQGFFYSLVCVMNQEMATRMGLNRVVRAIGEVYDRTQGALEEHGMLDLP
uniref:Uncharacterized protein n=1 Tax=Salmo trutta TaxID=8032 RepID=A0A674E1U2_SALTR